MASPLPTPSMARDRVTRSQAPVENLPLSPRKRDRSKFHLAVLDVIGIETALTGAFLPLYSVERDA